MVVLRYAAHMSESGNDNRLLRISAGGQTVVLHAGETASIGQDAEAVIRIDAPGVSPRHAVVRRDGDTWIVEDSGSQYGMYFGGQRVSRLAAIGPVAVHLGATDGPLVELTPVTSAAPGLLANLRIGRDADNDIVVDDLLVSAHHAEVRPLPGDGGIEIVDLGSHGGTFLNGRQVRHAPLEPMDIVSIGQSLFRVTATSLEPYVESTDVTLSAIGLTVTVAGRRGTKVLLDDVSFGLANRSLVAVVGPSGAGKSTLINALTGARPATVGAVAYAGRDLYVEYDDLRARIGVVPQDDLVQPELTARRALRFAAELRFPPDVGEAAREGRVASVLAELGLEPHADLPIRQLSGGQRKRTSVAMELLTSPALLFMDEPTSGLDPGLERNLMLLLRRLADGGRTIVVVTHSVQSLQYCDRVLFLAPGGRMAYFGPPQLALATFGDDDYQEVFRDLSVPERDWTSGFRTTDEYDRYVAQPLAQQAVSSRAVAAKALPATTTHGGWFRQMSTLTRRYLAVIGGDRRYRRLLLLQGPVVGLLMLVALPADQFAGVPPGEARLLTSAALVLIVVSLAVTGLGASNAVREIVKELPVFRRERSVGLSVSAYIASKFVVLSGIALVQSSVLVLIGLARQNGPSHAVVLGWPQGELVVAMAAGGIAATALGLLISALCSTVDRATTILPVILIVQLILAMAGADKPVLKQFGYLSGTGWSFNAAAATVDLNELQKVGLILREHATIDLNNPQPAFDALQSPPPGEPLTRHTAASWWTAMAAMLILTVAALIGTGVALLRYDPGVP